MIPLFKVFMAPTAKEKVGEVLDSGFIGQGPKVEEFEENLKKLIIRIIQYKKTVNAFILTNIVLMISFMSIITAIIFYILNSQNIKLENSTLTGLLIGLILSTALCVLIVWIYYRLVYGIIVKKLDKNLKQLKEIDSQDQA